METNDSNLGAKIVSIIFIILVPVLIIYKYGNWNTLENVPKKTDSLEQKTELPQTISSQVTINRTTI